MHVIDQGGRCWIVLSQPERPCWMNPRVCVPKTRSTDASPTHTRTYLPPLFGSAAPS